MSTNLVKTLIFSQAVGHSHFQVDIWPRLKIRIRLICILCQKILNCRSLAKWQIFLFQFFAISFAIFQNFFALKLCKIGQILGTLSQNLELVTFLVKRTLDGCVKLKMVK